jgi:chemotaxis protein methyltransferase CheR
MTGTALPEWTKRITNHDLRIWSAGCSSGEEPYTIAMVLDEYFGIEKPKWDSTILATDLSPKVLATAKQAIYPDEHVEQLSPQWQKKFFKKLGPNQWQIVPHIAKEVVFSQFNLMGGFERFKKKFHIIFCRNVMIYFDNPTKAALSKRYYSVLEPGGYLFIGLSETLSGLNTDFKQIAPAIYKKER